MTTSPTWQPRLACFTNSYGRFGAEAAIARLSSSGIEWLELAIRTAGHPSLFGDPPLLTDRAGPEDIERVLTLVESAGLRLCSANVSSGNPLDAEVVEITCRKFEIASQLGVSLVVGGGGEVDHPVQKEILWKHLKQLGAYARQRGLIYCCETHPGVCQHADAMLEMLEQVDDPGIRINFDTANLLYYNRSVDVARELERVMPCVEHVHLKDSSGKYRNWHFPALGRGGAINFAELWRIFAASGYRGPLSLEIEGIQGEPPLTLDETHQRIVESVQFLRNQGLIEG